MSRSKSLAATALAALLVGSLGACSTKSSDKSEDGGVKLGPGVSDGTINLTTITDLSGPFAPIGKDDLVGLQLYIEQLNKSGGICDTFEVKLDVKDSGYVLQRSVQQYGTAKSTSLAMISTMGSAPNAALQPVFEKDKMLNFPTAWGRSLTEWEGNVVAGATYDVDTANGVDYLIEEGLIDEGDTVGHIYFQGEFGENALAGSEAAAKQHNLEVVKAQIDPTDADMTAQVTRFKGEGVSAILLSAGPGQVGSVAAAVAAEGLEVPLLSNAPGFAVGLMEGPAAKVLKKQFYLTSPYAPTFEEGSDLAVAYEKANPGKVATNSMVAGAAKMEVMTNILNAACDAKDLTRQGLLDAKLSMKNVVSEGMVPLDLSNVGSSPSLVTNIQRPSDDPGRLTTVKANYEGTTAPGL